MTEIRLLPSHDETSSVRVLVIDDRSILLALDAMVDADFFCEERRRGEEQGEGGDERRVKNCIGAQSCNLL